MTESTEVIFDLKPCAEKKPQERKPLTVQSKLIIESFREHGYSWPQVKIELTDTAPFAVLHLSETSIPLIEGVTKEVIMEMAFLNIERDEEYREEVINKLNLVFDEYEKHKHCFN